VSAGDTALVLALSPLISPLRFVSRVGLSRLKDLEPLVARVVDAARPHATAAAAERLERMAAATLGFDSADDAHRREAISALVRELTGLVQVPDEISALASAVSEAPAKLGRMKQAALFAKPAPAPVEQEPPRPSPKRGAGPLATPLLQLRGVGPALAKKLQAKGLETVADLLLFLPRKYEDRRAPRTVAEAPVGERSVIAGRIGILREEKARRGRIFELPLTDGHGGRLKCVWFNYRPTSLGRVPPGAQVLISGEVRYRGGSKVIYHPDVELTDEPSEQIDESFGRMVPIYSEIEGIYPRQFRRIAKGAVDEYARWVPDDLPEAIRRRRKLLPLPEALREVHFPEKFVPGEHPRRRLAFDELFMVQLVLALRRRGVKVEPGIAFRATDEIISRAVSQLPWPLTGAQSRAVRAIAEDMRKPEPMNRLLQGDVGSGKTAVALCAALLAVADGYQAALMAPTEILAEQHAQSLRMLLRESRVHVELVTGGLGQRERDHAARLLRSGAAQIIVGTHALAEEGTAFHRLGLVVIDEQHRFGVMTRAKLMSKGHRPDVLVMTATPIPRTLALTLYGDLDTSVLDELPPGRTPIATKVYKDSAREKAYDLVRRELAAGRQVYVVLPLVEESEKLADLKAATKERDRLAMDVFPGVPVGLVHGRQAPAERQEAMERFRRGEDRILVATTVIEVGVDVPNATVMLIEHAERFGLSQLHQLRGRVGRGAAKSHCLLVTGTSGAEWGPAARQRLKVMEETTDGFRIAEADLELRGPGEFLGTRQSGMPDFAVAELARDQTILAEAREEAFALVADDPELKRAENQAVRDQLLNRWRGRLSLARVG
jgi:ATP-dependent DNA helicase RecG